MTMSIKDVVTTRLRMTMSMAYGIAMMTIPIISAEARGTLVQF